MQIIYTKRIIEYIFRLNNNLQRSSKLGVTEHDLEKMQINKIDVAPSEYEKAFKRLIMDKTGFSEREYEQTVLPLKIISGEEFEQNPYLQNIVLHNCREGNVRLEKEIYPKGRLMLYENSTFDSSFSQKFQFCVFDKDVTTYFIGTDDLVWLSITPSEVNSMKKEIKKAKGRILVLGGCLGYFPYMCSLKDNVTSITIIEKDPFIKRILEEQVIPQFPNNKTKIIEADAFDFMDSNITGKFDGVFVDIWENNTAGVNLYQKAVKYQKRYPEMHFDYWMEDNLLGLASCTIFMYFESKMDQKTEKQFSERFPDFYEYLEHLPDCIDRPEQLEYYLTHRYAKEMLENLDSWNKSSEKNKANA